MRRWPGLDPRNHLTRSDGRVVLTLATVGLLALGAHFVTSPTGPAARGPDGAPAPSTPSSDPPEIHREREAIQNDNRDRPANWTWAPTGMEIAARRDESAVLVTGPIVDAETTQRLEADVYVNDRPVARAGQLVLLMWDTRETPVFVDVTKSGYERWGMRYRFEVDGLRRVEGPVELQPEGSDDGGDGGMAWR